VAKFYPPQLTGDLGWSQPWVPTLGSLPLQPLVNLRALAWQNCTKTDDPPFKDSDRVLGTCMLHYFTYHELHKRRRAAWPFNELYRNPFTGKLEFPP
jgi:hypothetical protein